MAIKFDIEQEDVALVLKPNGHIDVYCPEVDKNGLADNVRLLRQLLISLVKESSHAHDVDGLLEEINKHIVDIPKDRTLH